MVTASVRIARLEGLLPKVQRSRVPSPLPSIVAAIEAAGGKLPNESPAMALARVMGTPVSALMVDLRERADRNNGADTEAKPPINGIHGA